MSKIALSGNASGTGTFTIASPNSNSDRTLTLPDSAGTIATAESTLAQFNASGSAPVYACRAWVNFDGTGTPAIREDGNVSSITDNGTGDYTVNFTTAMPDADYCMSASANSGANNVAVVNQLGTTSFAEVGANRTTTSIRLIVRSETSSATDTAGVFCSFFR
jgi:hypothetical protein